ncbi:hypothetical protein QQP08_021503 [Theobroma cacao]|nr:hypothetical protein QQP08_021503 [Theobroma cacao]
MLLLPKVKQKKPITPTWPRHRFPTSSVDNTRAQVPIVARPNPLINLKAEYIHIFDEKTVKREDKDIIRHERRSIFLRPRVESASVASASPPARHPMKKEEAGSPVMKEVEHSRPHSDMIDVCAGQSQDHEFLESWQMLESELQADDWCST